MPIVRVAAGVLRNTKGHLFLGKRRGPRHHGAWEFPGGKLEAGEDTIEALIREWREELGVTLLREDVEDSPVFAGFVSVNAAGPDEVPRIEVVHLTALLIRMGSLGTLPRSGVDHSRLMFVPQNVARALPVELQTPSLGLILERIG